MYGRRILSDSKKAARAPVLESISRMKSDHVFTIWFAPAVFDHTVFLSILLEKEQKYSLAEQVECLKGVGLSRLDLTSKHRKKQGSIL